MIFSCGTLVHSCQKQACIEAQHVGFAFHKAHPLPEGARFLHLGSKLQALKARAFSK